MRRSLTRPARLFGLIALVLAPACGFDVNVGSTMAVVVDAGTRPGPLCDAPELVAYEISIPEAQLDASCFLGAHDGGDTLPAIVTNAYLFTPPRASLDVTERLPTIGVPDFPAQQLGDTPLIKLPAAFAGQNNAFTWSDATSTREQFDGPGRMQVIVGGLSFDRLDTLFTAGTFALSSVWTCDHDADGGCLPARPDEVSCSISRRFTARRVELQQAWLPARPQTEGFGSWWLVSLDVGELVNAQESCQGNPPSLVRRRLVGVRSLELWQRSDDVMFLEPRTYVMPGAPPIRVGPTLSAGTKERNEALEVVPGALETRTTVTTVGDWQRAPRCSLLDQSATRDSQLGVASGWTCAGANCPQVTSTDHATCEAFMRFDASPLSNGPIVGTSP